MKSAKYYRVEIKHRTLISTGTSGTIDLIAKDFKQAGDKALEIVKSGDAWSPSEKKGLYVDSVEFEGIIYLF